MESKQQFRLLTECSYVARVQIELNPVDLDRIKTRDYLYVDVGDNVNNLVKCMVISNDKIKAGHVKASKRCLDVIGKDKELLNVYPRPFGFVNRGIPKIENINKKEVFASTDLIERYSTNVELVNIKNGYRMFVKLKNTESNEYSNKVFLNRYHLLLLGLDKGINENLVITTVDSFNKNNRIKRFFQWLWIILLVVSRSIGNFFIGSRELDLRVGYLFPFDENHRVARMHPNIRKFLGLDENDRLVVTYHQRSSKLPVLDLDSEHVDEVFKIENEFIDSHLYIGIPATTRNQLGVPNIGSVIKVRRSMKFILMKHINKLILPYLALMFAILSVIKPDTYSNIIKIIILVLIISPIVVFASLSEERAKVR